MLAPLWSDAELVAHMSASCRLRKGRSHSPGQYYLLMACCHDRVPVFLDQHAARIVLDSVLWLYQRGKIDLMVAVVMPDHLHLVVACRDAPLSEIMHSLKSYSAHAINQKCVHSGQVWQAGYHDNGIRDEAGLRAQVSYCLQNPVRAGLVDDFHLYPYWWCRWEV